MSSEMMADRTSGEADTDAAIERIVGRYWKIGETMGKNCYRQEEILDDPLALNNMQLFLHVAGVGQAHGWYITKDMAVSQVKGEEPLAYSKNPENHEIPQNIHVPQWKAKPSKHVVCALGSPRPDERSPHAPQRTLPHTIPTRVPTSAMITK